MGVYSKDRVRVKGMYRVRVEVDRVRVEVLDRVTG